MNSRDALKEKMKADRLSRLNTSSDNPQNETHKARFHTEDDESVVTSTVDRHQSDLEENEQKESQKLATTLTKKRNRLQQQLFQDSHNTEDEEEEDVGKTMQRVKQRVQQKLLEDEADATTTAAEDTADLSMAGDEASEDTGRATFRTMPADDEASAQTTSRSIATPRADGMTPRKAPESLNQSLKARLLEKLKAAKDHGKDLEYTDRKTEHKLAGKRGELRSTRFDDEDTVAKDAEKETTEKLESSRKLWKPVKNAVVEEPEPDVPTPEESYKFFMQVWESDEEADTKAKKSAPTSEQAGASAAEGPEPAAAAEEPEPADQAADNVVTRRKRRKKTGADDEQMLFEDEEDDFSWMPYQIAAADYVPFEEKLAQQENIYFVPSVVEAPVSQKIPANAEMRHLEEEGFYVGPRPYVTNSNLNRMENRLLKEAGRGKTADVEAAVGEEMSGAMKWFGEDGRLLAQPDPTKEISGRPPIMEKVASTLATKRISPEVIEQSATFGGNCYQLDVDVNTIILSHHHLFSREHVFASELSCLYDEYTARLKKNTVQFLSGKIKALKVAIQHVEDTICSLKEDRTRAQDERLLICHERRLKDYRDEIRLSRRQRDHEMETDRLLSKNIIRIWKEIKNLRATNKYNNTAAKLTIRKEPSNQVHDQEDWDEDVADEVIELREQAEEEFQHQLKLYNEQYNLWQEQKQRKKESKKRQAKRLKQPTQRLTVNGVEETAEDVGRDEAAINEPNLLKPVKPQQTTDTDVKQRIEAKYRQIRRLPGEPKIFFELTSGASITDLQGTSRPEQQRRNDVTKCRIFVKVLFNGKEVSKTESKPLGQDFIVRFARLFNLEIICWPESVTMEIYETFGMTTYLLSTVYAAVPEHNVTSQTGQLADINFSSELKMSHAHEGVGSGKEIIIGVQPPRDMILLTSGKLMASVLWAVDTDGNTMAPPVYGVSTRSYGGMRAKDPIADIGLSGLCDMEKLTKWIEDSKLDPNDPSNADIVHLMRPIGSGDALVPSYRRPDYFRLEHVQEEFDFVTDDDITNSRRFKLIVLRDQEVAFFKNQKVPLYDKEIDDSLFVDYDKKIREEERLREADDTDSHHIAVAKFMQKVREQVMARYRLATHHKTYEDLINEDTVPNISVVLPRMAELVEPQRPLRPKRIERKTVTSQNLSSVDVKIIVNIVRAFGIPVRDTVENTSEPPVSPRRGMEDTSRRQQIGQESRVHPFVEAMFQQNVLSTSVAQGTNPTWHEEICIPFKAPHNDYSSSALQTVNDSLFLNLFDEYVTDVAKDDRDSTTIHRRVERRWLGGLKIPFTTIYTNGRIEGTFCVDRPPVLLGYKKENRVVGGESGAEVGNRNSDNTYMTLFVTIEPPLAAPEPYQERFESMETDELMSECYKFMAEVQDKFPKRNYLVTVVSLEGVAIFVSRYIKPQKPPEEVLAGGQDLVARYVSLIPFVSDNVVFPGLCDIWSDSAQFLQMLQGDEEEHAVLLTNYFLHMGKKAWLITGSAIPEGDTSYVLTQEDGDFWLWKAATGEHFSSTDSYCPLQSIACVINHENVWANIQPHDKPSQISFQFSNASQWKPFFHKKFPNPGLGSIQPDDLTYHVTSTVETTRLQNKIEDELKKKISEWRPRFVTRWNRLCIQSFRKLLKTLEESQGQALQSDHVDELRDVLNNYTMCGFPLNMSYTDMKSICDAVFATGVHVYESSDVEFALAVYVHAYPNTVMSVWVYVASLTRKRS